LKTNFEELNSYKFCFGNRKIRDQLGQPEENSIEMNINGMV
jgi:hypothetical protein